MNYWENWAMRGYPDPLLPDELAELIDGEPGSPDQARLVNEAVQFIANLPSGPDRSLKLPDEAEVAILAAARLHSDLARASVEREAPEIDLDVARYGMVRSLNALGMWATKRQFEDAILKAELRERWKRLRQRMRDFQEKHEEFTEEISNRVEGRLAETGIAASANVVWCSVAGASRRLQALRLPNFELAQAPDFFDVYVLVESADDCYRALAGAHAVGPPAPGGFQDLIVAPHPNGFSGLTTRIRVHRHANVATPVPEAVNLVLQTRAMNDVAWHGITHPSCREGESDLPFVATLKANLGRRLGVRPSITVYTKGGRRLQPTARDMEAGTTVLDLAYNIHSAIGNEAVAAVVNGEPVESLGQVLEQNDVVEIRRDKSGRKPRSLEDLDLVTTPATRSRLKHGLNQQGLGMKGCLAIQQQLEERGFSIREQKELDHLVGDAASQLSGPLKDRPAAEIYRRVGRLIEIAEKLATEPEKDEATVGPTKPPTPRDSVSAGSIAAAVADEVIRVGMERLLPGASVADQWRPMLVESAGDGDGPQFAKLCRHCRPASNHEIVGIRRRRHVMVHVSDCRHIHAGETSQMRWMPVQSRVRSVINLAGSDRDRLVIEVCERVSRFGCGLEQVTAKAGHLGKARMTLHVYGDSSATISKLVKGLEQVHGVAAVQQDSLQMPDIRDVRRRGNAERKGVERSTAMKGQSRTDAMPLALHVRPTGQHTRHNLIHIPYNPQHPCLTGRFYGREHESAVLAKALEDGTGPFLFIRGPRTIGKSSLAMRFTDHLDEDKRPDTVRVDLRSCRSDTSEVAFEKVIAELRKKLPSAATVPDRARPEQTLDALIEAHDRRLLLVLDEFGGPLESFAKGRLGHQFFDWIRRTMDSAERKVVLMMAGPPEAAALLDSVAHRDLGERLTQFPLTGLSPNATREMFSEPLVEEGVSVRQDAVEALTALCGGHPYYVILLLQKLADRLNRDREQWQVTSADVNACLDDLFADRLPLSGWLAESAPTPTLQVCLDALVRAQERGGQFVDVTDIARSAGLGVGEVRSAMERLNLHQVVEGNPGFSEYRFSFPLLREWIRRGGVRRDFFDALGEDERRCLFAAADPQAKRAETTVRQIAEVADLSTDIAAFGVEQLVDSGLLSKRRNRYRFSLPIVRVWIEDERRYEAGRREGG